MSQHHVGVYNELDLAILECLTSGINQRFHLAAAKHFLRRVTPPELEDEEVDKLGKRLAYGQISAAGEIIKTASILPKGEEPMTEKLNQELHAPIVCPSCKRKVDPRIMVPLYGACRDCHDRDMEATMRYQEANSDDQLSGVNG